MHASKGHISGFYKRSCFVKVQFCHGFIGTVSVANPDNAQLSLTAFAKEKGDNAAVPVGVSVDLAGNPRKNGVVDMGAYEEQN